MITLLVVVVVVGTARGVVTSLGGRHLRVTVVHDGSSMMETSEFVNMIDPRNTSVLLPPSQWTGFIIDLIIVIADLANFTFTLLPPSGVASNCVCNETPDRCSCEEDDDECAPGATSKAALVTARDYNCGAEDVLSLNRSDIYFSMYYQTKERVARGTLFTTPFLSGSSLAVMRRTPRDNWMEQAVSIFRPFKWPLWVYVCGAATFVAIVIWLTEHAHPPDFREVVAEDGDVDFQVHQSVWKASGATGGYATGDSFRRDLPQAFFSSWYTVLAGQPLNPSTVKGDTLNLAWCLFGVIFVSSYTANLAAILSKPGYSLHSASLEDLDRNRKTVCTRSGTAYSKYVNATFPNLDVRETLHSVADLEREACDALVDTLPHLQAVVNNKDYCGDSIYVHPDSALAYGPRDMAAGVRASDGADIAEALSFWISELGECATSYDRFSTCYLRSNINRIWREHAETNACASDDDDATVPELKAPAFALPFTLVAAAGLACLVRHVCCCCSPAPRDRFNQLARTPDLYDLLASAYPEFWTPEDDVDFDRLREAVTRDTHTRDDLLPSMLRHYLKTDVETWQRVRTLDAHRLALQTAQDADAFDTRISALKRAERQTMIDSCVRQLAALLDRAVREQRRSRFVRVVERRRRSVGRVLSSTSCFRHASFLPSSTSTTTTTWRSRSSSPALPARDQEQQRSRSWEQQPTQPGVVLRVLRESASSEV
ncbi:hypothetical protein CTAYLR_005811 [Chrysophaeum taylorii]|uniref:Ionotropic glutamate receptor C-terminal domain-containing protein n=1 Tax=Chrysophaeum taylorii TaxID=2483200 RepID=A0AAD7UNW3_9STRA|nr:hypothetical protein CTAYLR_005811 [Chrysophaeum taylorii]